MGQRPQSCEGWWFVERHPSARVRADGPALILRRWDDAQGVALPTVWRAKTFLKVSDELREVGGGAVKRKCVGEPVVVANVVGGLLPRLDEKILLAKELTAGLERVRNHGWGEEGG